MHTTKSKLKRSKKLTFFFGRHYHCLDKKITSLFKNITRLLKRNKHGETAIVNNNDGSLWPSILEIGQVKKIYKI